MLKKRIEYTNYNGDPVAEDFYFNLTKSELIRMETTEEGGLADRLQRIVDKKDVPEIMRTFEFLLAKAYGEKSPDGRRFIKSDEISKAFFETPAYDELFVELMMNPDYAAQFIQELIPDLSDLDKRKATNGKPGLAVVSDKGVPGAK